MTRKEKYTLDRILIGLDSAVQELEDYVNTKASLDRMFGDPMCQLEKLFHRRVAECEGKRKRN